MVFVPPPVTSKRRTVLQLWQDSRQDASTKCSIPAEARLLPDAGEEVRCALSDRAAFRAEIVDRSERGARARPGLNPRQYFRGSRIAAREGHARPYSEMSNRGGCFSAASRWGIFSFCWRKCWWHLSQIPVHRRRRQPRRSPIFPRNVLRRRRLKLPRTGYPSPSGGTAAGATAWP